MRPESFVAPPPSPPPSSSSHNPPPSSPQWSSVGEVAAVSQEFPGIAPLPGYAQTHTYMKIKLLTHKRCLRKIVVIRSHIWPHLNEAGTRETCTFVGWHRVSSQMCHLPLHPYRLSCPKGCNNNLCISHCSQQFDGINQNDVRERVVQQKTEAFRRNTQSVSIR